MKILSTTEMIPFLIDDEDEASVSKHQWSFFDRYIETHINGKRTKLHRFILGIDDPNIHVDHINRATTDNRKENLRICTHSQNMCNRKLNTNNKTGVKGVHQLPNGHYRVRVGANGTRYEVGVFVTLEEAKRERENFAREKHGEFYRQK
jgi:hypothetical protein